MSKTKTRCRVCTREVACKSRGICFYCHPRLHDKEWFDEIFPSKHRSNAGLLEDWSELHRHGVDIELAAQRLGTTVRHLERFDLGVAA